MSKVKKHGILNMLLMYLGVALGFLNTILRAKVLTPEEIGVLSIIMTITTVVGYSILFGVPAALLKYHGRFQNDIKKKSAFYLSGFLMPGVLFCISSILFYIFQMAVLEMYSNQLLSQFLGFVYIFFLGHYVNFIFNTIMRAEYKSVQATIIYNMVWRVLNTLFLFLMLINDIPFTYFFYFTLFQILLRIVLFTFYCKVNIPFQRPDWKIFNKSFSKEILVFSFFMFSSGVAGILVTSIDKLMLGYFLGMEEVGIYTIVLTFPFVLRVIAKSFDKIVEPLIAESWTENDIKKIETTFQENIKFQFFFGAFVYLMFVFHGQNVLNFLGDEYSTGFLILIFLSTGELVNLLTGMCQSIIAYSNYYKVEFLTRASLVVLTILTNLMLIPAFGINGAAFATFLSITLYKLINMGIVYSLFKINPYDRECLIILACSAVFGLALWLGQDIFFPENPIFILLGSLLLFLTYIMTGAFIFRIPFLKSFLKKGMVQLKLKNANNINSM